MREAFPIILKFEGPERRFEFEDSVTVQIDLQPNVDPASYSIYAGFEMSPEELSSIADDSVNPHGLVDIRLSSSSLNFVGVLRRRNAH